MKTACVTALQHVESTSYMHSTPQRRTSQRIYIPEEQAVMQELGMRSLTNITSRRKGTSTRWRVQFFRTAALGGPPYLAVGHYLDLRTAIRERDLAVVAVHGRKEANRTAPATLLPASSYSEQEVAATVAKLQQRFQNRPDVLALMCHSS